MDTVRHFSGANAAETWSWSLTSNYCRGQENLDIYIHSPIRLHGLMLSWLSTGTNLPLWCRVYVSVSELKWELEVAETCCCTYAQGCRGCKKGYVWYSVACWQNLWLNSCIGITVQGTDKVCTSVSVDRSDLEHYSDRSYSVQRILKFLHTFSNQTWCHGTEKVDRRENRSINCLDVTCRSLSSCAAGKKKKYSKRYTRRTHRYHFIPICSECFIYNLYILN
jgi:hypothetical protein